MKHSITTSLLILGIVFTACRKETPAELPGNAVISEYTCYNGVLDGDEDGIDCGPSCTPCVLSIADCGLPVADNTFDVSSGANLSFSAGSVTSDASSGALVITATSGSSYVKATFYDADPTIFTSYSVSSGLLTASDVKLEYFTGTYLYKGYSDDLHLNRVSGNLSFEFCDVYMNTPSIGGFIVADGKITEN